ncbi:phosphotransferase family protein [Novosphingobium cyanobacteriorum]|uniref:Phosphotransferase family protein n=1 Tax=Novosphingobium cyanobacteriorum TaxID=3024215 RepID=A0ABT6CLV3_9SPHN|nr:phosphotransferase family protein [Novosphingobium cyanobacteriorum]MDF8334896.1 phosphotransferase family protein [Novosphingobium cyanobacteriorum]
MIGNVDLVGLAGWMDAQGLGKGPIDDVRMLSGGTQNILMRFRRMGENYVLRRPPFALRDNSNETMRREARVLKALDGSGVPHPRLIAACASEDVIGSAFYLMEPVEGFNPAEGLPALHTSRPELRHRIGLAMVEAIAALGAIDWQGAGLTGFGKPENYLERQVGRWKAQLVSYQQLACWPGPANIPGIERVASWLEKNRPTSFTPGIIHGDFHLANVMVRPDNGDLAAVVDWELSTIGDPLLDLGWLLATWPEGETPASTDVAVLPWSGFATPDELTHHYANVTGRSLENLDWYVVLACFKLGIILEGTFARACAGQARMEVGNQLHAQTIDLFARALRRIDKKDCK